MSMWQSYNPNPQSYRVGDCTVRAISKATEQDWETTYAGLTAYGFMMCDMPNANHVWGAYLKSKGFRKNIIPDEFPNNYTVEDFCRDNPSGTFVLVVEGHVVCAVDGCYYDTWDSGKEVPSYYWKK